MFGIIKKPENNVSEILSNDSIQDENNKQLSDLTNLNLLSNNNTPPWESNLDWLDNVSWSKILISDSESLRSGMLNRQKDTLMVVLIRRLEYFPNIQTINQIKNLFEAELAKLEATQIAIKAPTSNNQDIENEATQNPILTQASLEVESELKKILIEKDSFDKKINSEIEILSDLCATIAGQNDDLGKQKMLALLDLYSFEYNYENGELKIKLEKNNPSEPIKIRIYSDSTPKLNL